MENESKARYSNEIQSMMYVFGDVRNPLSSTAEAIEKIVHKQLITILIDASNIVKLRGGRGLSAEDILFVIRKDPVKLNRLKEYLIWKDVRKNAKSEQEVELDMTLSNPEDEPAEEEGSIIKKNKVKSRIPWDVLADIVVQNTGGYVDPHDPTTHSDPTLFTHPKAVADNIQRLSAADKATKNMSKQEYLEYSDCRTASFTFKKAKKFRDWINIQKWSEYRMGDEIVEIMGFLGWELVRKIVGEMVRLRDRAGIDRQRKRNITGECLLFASNQDVDPFTPDDISEAVYSLSKPNIVSSLLSPDASESLTLRL